MTSYVELEASIMRYVNDGVPTGGFLNAMLENNLVETFGRADTESTLAIPRLINLLYNDVPSTCWGSPKKVAKWFQRHAEAREKEGVEP